MFEVFLWLVQGSSPTEDLHSLIAAHDCASFQLGGTPSQTGLQREYANHENGLWF